MTPGEALSLVDSLIQRCRCHDGRIAAVTWLKLNAHEVNSLIKLSDLIHYSLEGTGRRK